MMITRIQISDYVSGRYNQNKLEKLKKQLEEAFSEEYPRQPQDYPDEGILIEINMSAKHQTLYVKCSEWGNYKAVGELEDIILTAIEDRGFEPHETQWEKEYFKIGFE